MFHWINLQTTFQWSSLVYSSSQRVRSSTSVPSARQTGTGLLAYDSFIILQKNCGFIGTFFVNYPKHPKTMLVMFQCKKHELVKVLHVWPKCFQEARIHKYMLPGRGCKHEFVEELAQYGVAPFQQSLQRLVSKSEYGPILDHFMLGSLNHWIFYGEIVWNLNTKKYIWGSTFRDNPISHGRSVK